MNIFENEENREAIINAMEYFNNRCPYCDEELLGDEDTIASIEVDHFYPRIKGGQAAPWNIVPTCRRCNIIKGGRDPEEFLPATRFKRISNYLRKVKEQKRTL